MSPAAVARKPREAARARAPKASAPDGYFARSRTLAASFLAIAPLLALYETGIALTGSPVVNGADALVRRAFLAFGPTHAALAWRIAIALCFALAVLEVVRKRMPVHRDLPGIAAEGLAYGALLGPLALLLQRRVLPFLAAGAEGDGRLAELILSVGAGVYEEIVFRLLLLTAVFAVVVRIFDAKESGRVVALAVAVAASSAVFSAFHHFGPEGEPFAVAPFLFRAIAGAVLGVIFVLRGLGVAVYTHAAYDCLRVFL